MSLFTVIDELYADAAPASCYEGQLASLDDEHTQHLSSPPVLGTIDHFGTHDPWSHLNTSNQHFFSAQQEDDRRVFSSSPLTGRQSIANRSTEQNAFFPTPPPSSPLGALGKRKAPHTVDEASSPPLRPAKRSKGNGFFKATNPTGQTQYASRQDHSITVFNPAPRTLPGQPFCTHPWEHSVRAQDELMIMLCKRRDELGMPYTQATRQLVDIADKQIAERHILDACSAQIEEEVEQEQEVFESFVQLCVRPTGYAYLHHRQGSSNTTAEMTTSSPTSSEGLLTEDEVSVTGDEQLLTTSEVPFTNSEGNDIDYKGLGIAKDSLAALPEGLRRDVVKHQDAQRAKDTVSGVEAQRDSEKTSVQTRPTDDLRRRAGKRALRGEQVYMALKTLTQLGTVCKPEDKD